jgi:hypothetical protein
MMVAEKLGLTLEQAMDLSHLELRLWAAYYSLQKKENERAMKNGRRKYNR